jgi:hypothetical protein
MTGFINYIDRPPDERLLRLREIWEQLGDDGKLPAYGASILTEFPLVAEHASIIRLDRQNGKTRYFVIKDGPAVVAASGLDLSGTYLDDPSDAPELAMILAGDYDGIVKSRAPRLYAEEHHLDGRVRKTAGIQLPFAADGETVDHIVEFVYPLDD